MQLADAVRAHAERWKTTAVERELFGSEDSRAIAALVERFCRDVLAARVTSCLRYESSVGAVAGLELADGPPVLVKVHRPRVGLPRLQAMQAVMRTLCAGGYPCPRPLLAPTPLAQGLATVESWEDIGEHRDAHDPAVRRALAAGLAAMLRLVPATAAHEPLRQDPWPGLYLPPHSAIFDFERTAAGAEWIDALAVEARRIPKAGALVVGHSDWRTEHVRFDGDRIAMVYDWDSLRLDTEPALVGGAATGFTADFTNLDVEVAPSADELLAFVADYEVARGRAFTPAERRSALASAVSGLAYTSRCEHALGNEAASGRAVRDLLAGSGAGLLRSV